jgi:16S rRNA (cytosine1402-N4)-methyltransferase
MHIAVLVKEAVEWLRVRPEGVYVDATVGGSGHSRAILEKLDTGRLIGLDKDAQAIESAQEALAEYRQKLTLVQQDFAGLLPLLRRLELNGVDGILADLGLSQMQIDSPERGFSFQAEGPLDMRMDTQQRLTAADIVNHFDQRELADLIYQYGEERRSLRIARAIVRARPIRNTVQLAKLIEACLGGRRGFSRRQSRLGSSRGVAPRTIKKRFHSATQTFQALRIAVNSELVSLAAFLNNAPSCLNPGGRLVIISFHSLEDRLVKRQFQQWDRAGVMKNLTAHVVRPGEAETHSNPRSRSARLRAAERLPDNAPKLARGTTSERREEGASDRSHS